MGVFPWYNQCNEMLPRVTSTGSVSHRDQTVTASIVVPPTDSDNLKRCSKCGELRATEHFYVDRSRSGGLSSRCRECSRAEARRWSENNKDRKARADHDRYTVQKEQRSDYNHQYYLDHRAELLRYQNDYRRINPSKVKRVVDRWVRSNPDRSLSIKRNYRARIRHADGAHSEQDLLAIRAAQTDKQGRLICWACGNPITGTPHLDHWIPLKHGGRNDAGNLHFMHGSCNTSKGAKLPTEIGRLL